jgi:hypothetical protein
MVPNYISKTNSTTTAIVLCAVPLLYILVKKILHRLSAPIRQLPGPKSVSWLNGSLERHAWEPDSQGAQLEWTEKYGPVFKYYGMFNVSILYVTNWNNWIILYFQEAKIIVTDLQALNHILNAPEFDKPYTERQFLRQFTGKGWPNFLGNRSV